MRRTGPSPVRARTYTKPSRSSKKTRRAERPLWRNPGVVVFLLAAAMVTAGFAVFLKARHDAPVLSARMGPLAVRLERARWMVDHMDHSGGFSRPAAMMPGMPEPGEQRLAVELAFRNVGVRPVRYGGHEFSLVTDRGKSYEVYGSDLGTAELRRGQSLNTSLYFDVDTTEDPGRLRLLWRRDGATVYMPLPDPPEHYHARPRGDVVWPGDVTLLLPVGNSDRGAVLFTTTYGCIACHGDPKRPGTNMVGPHLGAIGVVAGEREAEKAAPQYIYESILRPNDFIVEECRDGVPCSSPSAMPDYAQLLSLQDMADLVTYLMLLTGTDTAAGEPSQAGS